MGKVQIPRQTLNKLVMNYLVTEGFKVEFKNYRFYHFTGIVLLITDFPNAEFLQLSFAEFRFGILMDLL